MNKVIAERVIGEVKRTRSLSRQSLNAVWKWCEANSAEPLAEAYVDACVLAGKFLVHGERGICKRLEQSWPVKGPGDYSAFHRACAEGGRAGDISFIVRDIIGRTILDMLKREAALARKSSSVRAEH